MKLSKDQISIIAKRIYDEVLLNREEAFNIWFKEYEKTEEYAEVVTLASLLDTLSKKASQYRTDTCACYMSHSVNPKKIAMYEFQKNMPKITVQKIQEDIILESIESSAIDNLIKTIKEKYMR